MDVQSLSDNQQIVTMESYAHMMLNYTQHNETNIRFRTVCTCESCQMVRTIVLSDLMLKDPNYQGFRMFFEAGGTMDVYLEMLRNAQEAVESKKPENLIEFLRSLFPKDE
jgi:hypothetical protein